MGSTQVIGLAGFHLGHGRHGVGPNDLVGLLAVRAVADGFHQHVFGRHEGQFSLETRRDDGRRL